jgi:hypothetical protein
MVCMAIFPTSRTFAERLSTLKRHQQTQRHDNAAIATMDCRVGTA